jgi:prepilin-type N-terminal cleavage/methylation domain-containing protein
MNPKIVSKRRGFTLVELSVATMMGLLTSAMVLSLVNQQLAFLKVYQAQDFLTEEAPVISMYVSKLVGKADRFRLHESMDDALLGLNPRLTPSPVVVLNYRQPDGSMRAAFLSFEDRGSGPALYYFAQSVGGTVNDPQWTVTHKASNVEFSMEQGVLRVALTGPAGEKITYSGTMQQ